MKKDIFDLSGKVALVTGASRGIGEAIATLLAEQGAHVIVTSRKIADCQRVVERIGAAGGSAAAFCCHIGELEQVEQLFEMIRQRHGRLDILVNNAATNPYFGHILDTDLGAFQKTVDVNIRGYFMMSVHAGKIMKEQGGGAIVNVASVNGVSPGATQGIYSITKAAVINMTKAFAKGCGAYNIRVNALLPGLTETRFAAALTSDAERMKASTARIPLGRSAKPAEMAGAVLYLVSDAASYTTESCVTVDGGYLA